MTKEKHKPDYIDEHDEWQRNQFVPGHYTEGRIPPYIKYPGKPKRLALMFAVYSVVYFTLLAIVISGLNPSGMTFEFVLNIVFLGALSIIYLVACISLFMKQKS